MNKIISTDKAPKAIGPYSQAYQCGNTLYCSGQIPVDPKTGQLVEANVTIQTQKCIENIISVLKESDMGIKNVVKTSCFLKEMSNFAEFNEIYAKYFTHRPARSCVAVKELPKGALVEIEVIAVK